MGSTSAMRPSAAGPASSDPRSLGDRRSCALPSTPLAPGRGGLFQRRQADAPVARRRQGRRGLDLVVQRRPDTEAALKLLKRLLRNQPVAPERIVTDGLGSYPAALDQLRSPAPAFTRSAEGESAENSHLPIRRRERQQQLFKSQVSAQRFLTTHAAIYNTIYTQRHLISRPTLRRFRAGA